MIILQLLKFLMGDLNAAPTPPHSGFNHVWGLPALLPSTQSSTGQSRRVLSDSLSDASDCMKVYSTIVLTAQEVV